MNGPALTSGEYAPPLDGERGLVTSWHLPKDIHIKEFTLTAEILSPLRAAFNAVAEPEMYLDMTEPPSRLVDIARCHDALLLFLAEATAAAGASLHWWHVTEHNPR